MSRFSFWFTICLMSIYLLFMVFIANSYANPYSGGLLRGVVPVVFKTDGTNANTSDYVAMTDGKNTTITSVIAGYKAIWEFDNPRNIGPYFFNSSSLSDTQRLKFYDHNGLVIFDNRAFHNLSLDYLGSMSYAGIIGVKKIEFHNQSTSSANVREFDVWEMTDQIIFQNVFVDQNTQISNLDKKVDSLHIKSDNIKAQVDYIASTSGTGGGGSVVVDQTEVLTKLGETSVGITESNTFTKVFLVLLGIAISYYGAMFIWRLLKQLLNRYWKFSI